MSPVGDVDRVAGTRGCPGRGQTTAPDESVIDRRLTGLLEGEFVDGSFDGLSLDVLGSA